MQYKDIKTDNGLMRYTYDNTIIELRRLEYAFKDNSSSYNKFLNFTKNMDIVLSGFELTEEETNSINFEILKDDITYPLFLKLMGNDRELTIESDDCKKRELKYIKFINCGNEILISIVNNNTNSDITNKFSIFIKNIYTFDIKSNIDKNSQNLKNRILELFDDFQKLFEEYHNAPINIKKYPLNYSN